MPDREKPVLIVEDDEPTQNLLVAVLRKSGYSAEVAADGHKAIALLQTNTYAAVVLDLMMPGTSGLSVISFLAGAERRVPVVVCSAAGTAALTGLDPAVVKAVIRKPFDIDELISAVRSASEQSSVEETLKCGEA